MCGITGLLSNAPEGVACGILQGMTAIIAHRGPDGEGHWINANGQVGLGHRRLSIIDLTKGGHQPMHYADMRYTITFNGEIYNYIELRERLSQKGYRFKSASDTEVLMALYDAERENCLASLDGMFAFAIWDEVEQTLFFARDRFGEKPFHYCFEPGKRFLFGSEMKSLWAAGVPKVIDNRMLYRYLVHNEIMDEDDLSVTFFENIKRLKPGYYGIVHLPSFRLSIKQYWSIEADREAPGQTLEQASEKFRELFFNAVSLRLRSDVPFGSSLSGGLDSSAIVCAINHLTQRNGGTMHTFSARFPGFKKDEGEHINKVLACTRTIPHFIYPDENDLLSRIKEVAWHQEEPFGSASINVQNEVMKAARESDIKVLLDGQGADEVLAGYHFYFKPFFYELKHRNKAVYKTQLSKYHQLHATNTINNVVYNDSLKERIKDLMPVTIQKQFREMNNRRKITKGGILNRDFMDANMVGSSKSWTTHKGLNNSLKTSTTGSGLQELLRYADRNSMQHSVEVRLPFLSHHLVEYIFTLPSEFKMFDGWNKYLMRMALKDILPAEITWRKDKIGYEPPQQQWMDGQRAKEMIRDIKESLVKDRILDINVLNTEIPADSSIYQDTNWKILQVGMTLL